MFNASLAETHFQVKQTQSKTKHRNQEKWFSSERPIAFANPRDVTYTPYYRRSLVRALDMLHIFGLAIGVCIHSMLSFAEKYLLQWLRSRREGTPPGIQLRWRCSWRNLSRSKLYPMANRTGKYLSLSCVRSHTAEMPSRFHKFKMVIASMMNQAPKFHNLVDTCEDGHGGGFWISQVQCTSGWPETLK